MDEYSLSIVLDNIDDEMGSNYYSHIIHTQCDLSVSMPDELIFDDIEDYM